MKSNKFFHMLSTQLFGWGLGVVGELLCFWGRDQGDDGGVLTRLIIRDSKSFEARQTEKQLSDLWGLRKAQKTFYQGIGCFYGGDCFALLLLFSVIYPTA